MAIGAVTPGIMICMDFTFLGVRVAPPSLTLMPHMRNTTTCPWRNRLVWEHPTAGAGAPPAPCTVSTLTITDRFGPRKAGAGVGVGAGVDVGFTVWADIWPVMDGIRLRTRIPARPHDMRSFFMVSFLVLVSYLLTVSLPLIFPEKAPL